MHLNPENDDFRHRLPNRPERHDTPASGKVRDIYAVDDQSMLIVTTDRLSAFDVVLPDPIPDKGRVLTQISIFWFDRTAPHRTESPDRTARSRSCRCRRRSWRCSKAARSSSNASSPCRIEAVVRGYLIGSGWKDYQRSGRSAASRCRPACSRHSACPRRSSRPRPRPTWARTIRTSPSTQVSALIGADACGPGARDGAGALPVRRRVRARARHHHRRHQVRIRPRPLTGELTLIDEVLTPDSLALLARRHLPGRHQPAVLRQAVSCATIWKRWTGTSARPDRRCRARSSRAPATSISKPCSD